jgi:pimeloyl-ACP methyl ester carboxylesterase
MHDEALDVLPKIIEAAAIQDCILIGHSDGGSIAIIYAGGTKAVPLRGIVTEAAHVFCEDISVRSIQQAKIAFDEHDLRPKLEKYHGPNVDCAFRGWNDVWLHPDFVNWNLEEFLPNIQVPLLVIQGEHDEYGTQAQVESIVRQAGGDTEVLMIPDCGHAPHKAQEAVTLEAMTVFIKKILS